MVLLLAAGACAAPGSEPVEEPGLPADLGAPAAPLPSSELPAGTPVPATESPAPTPTAGSQPPGSAPGGASPAPVRTVAAVPDGSGDAGLQAPAYADLRAVTIVDTGRRARVVIDLGAGIPRRLAEGEVMGLGVDLYRDAGDESTYQLFADGSSDGWFAYLQTPDGFVAFPGSFQLGASRMAFTVPWRAIRGSRAVRTFVDWSQRAVPLNRVGQDAAPDAGTAPIAR